MALTYTASRVLDETHALMTEIQKRYGPHMGDEAMRTLALAAMTRMPEGEPIITSPTANPAAGEAGPPPELSLGHLRSRTNQSNENYYYTPFGTYVMLDLSHPRQGDEWQLRLVYGHWDEDSWQQSDRPEDTVLAQGVTKADAKSILLYDVLRRWRETPPVAEIFPGATFTAI